MKQCKNCGKGSIMRGARKKLRGKYNPTTYVRKYPNLQKTIIGGKRMLACMDCLKKEAKNGGKVLKVAAPKVAAKV